MTEVLRELLVNSIRTPDGTVLTSRNRHDYVTHTDIITGEWYMRDGGTEYIRGSINIVPAEDLCVYSDDPHFIIRDSFSWGSYGKAGKEPLKYILLKDLTINHIQAILDTQHPHSKIKKIFLDELTFREQRL